MRRESARTVGSRCQTGHTRNYPRIEDQGAEDQQEPLQGDRFLEKRLAKADYNTRNITKFAILTPTRILHFQQLTTGAWLAFSVTERNAKNWQESGRGRSLYFKRPDRQRAHRRAGSAHRRRRERSPHHF